MEHLIHVIGCHGEWQAVQAALLALADAIPYVATLRARIAALAASWSVR